MQCFLRATSHLWMLTVLFGGQRGWTWEFLSINLAPVLGVSHKQTALRR